MLNYEISKLDYFELLSLRNDEREVKNSKYTIAILADCATQHFRIILDILFQINGLEVKVIELDFDTIELEVFNPNSRLYTIEADYIILFNSVQKLREKFYHTSESKKVLIQNEKQKLESIWETLQSNGSWKILQTNFALPIENLFGSFELKSDESLYSVVSSMNQYINEKIRENQNLVLLDIHRLSSYVGVKNFLDETLYYHSKTPCNLEFIPHLAQLVVDHLIASKTKSVKCLVLDLDNTLWGGVIGDDGVEGISLGHLGDGEAYVDFQHFVLELKKRGIVLTVCSKNEESNAKIPFEKHPEMVLKLDDIAIFLANWDNKADNIKVIKDSLNIGYDSIVFLDDNPYERNLVRQLLPEVIVPELPEDPAFYVRHISDLNLFDTSSFTDEDKSRADMYRVEFERQNAQKRYSNIEDYLKSLDMEITLKKFDDFNIPRIAQLIQRSNQFNLTTKRYSEVECKAMIDNEKLIPLYCKLKDKYGDYGLISVVVLKINDMSYYIDEWIMSCRVLSRGVEEFIMNSIIRMGIENKIESIIGEYIPTAKNNMVKDFYPKFGFNESNQIESAGKIFSIKPEEYKMRTVYLNKGEENDKR